MDQQGPDAGHIPDNASDKQDSALSELERQVERGSLFAHTSLSRNSLHIAEVESFTYGLMDILLAKGIITSEEVTSAVENVRQESIEKGDVPGPGVALRTDASEELPTARVDCGARMHICHAVCCKLDFALAAPEVESGKVKWDLGRPYFIRHTSEGFCTHNNRATGGCGVYEDRPTICRTYSCANDERIWKNFAAMELNTEWLNENLVDAHPLVVMTMMQSTQYSPASSDITPEEAALIESGLPGIRAVINLLNAPELVTRKHAQRVLEGAVMRLHGWVPGQGYTDPSGEGKTQDLLRANGSYQANATREERALALDKWSLWLEAQEAGTVGSVRTGDVKP
jgi:Fe-S-cluster containining protein